MHRILLYGANGYTAKLILDEILKSQLPKPLLIGRNARAIEALADSYMLDFAVADAQDIGHVLKKQKKARVLINAAGPFVETALDIATACIAHGVHYIDITGEISVFQQLQTLDTQAKSRGVMLLPGAGFDVVPTDCLAFALKQSMPQAESLVLAFAGLGGGSSRGTALTAIRQISNTTWMRKDGRLTPIPWRKEIRKIDFGPIKATCLPIPWGDLETAWFSTGIANIMVFTPFSKKIRRWLPILTWLASVSWINKILRMYISRNVEGPDQITRQRAQTHVIGEVSSGAKTLRMHISTPEGYTFTAHSVVAIVKRIIKDDYRTGYQTPATAYGYQLLDDIPGVSRLSR